MRASLALACLIAVLALPASAGADTWCIPPATRCDHGAATVQDAIDEAGGHKGTDILRFESPSGTVTELDIADPPTGVTAPPKKKKDDAAATTAGPKTSVWDNVQNWMITWLPIVFMGVICALILMTLRYMPRTKPQEIKPDSRQSTRWEDVAGADEAKDELREVVEFLRDPKRFKKLGATVPRGILLHGPPGTGKTLLAKAVANESKAQFFAQSAASFVEMFVGLGAARIRRLFRVARKAAPAIIFIDELDAVGATRGADVSGEKDQTLNQLLVEMDGFSTTDNVVVIAASNMLEKLDPALLRPGRFDRQIFVAPPDLRGRVEILKVHTAKMPLQDVNFETVARQTSGLTGAELANICNEAAIFAGRSHRDVVLMRDFEGALERVVAGMQSRKVINDHEKRVVAYHEAGHALCSELLPSVEQVHKISIVPRGGALGYTLNLPEEDRYLKSREELIDYMVVLLGGRVAEQIVFGSITTGASGDLKKVYEISRQMVTEYAMGGSTVASRRLPTDDYSVSDNTRRIVDEEQQEITDLAYRRGQALIGANRDLLEALAQGLLEREILEREDISVIVKAHSGVLVAAEPTS
jgi:cell division protease FtsH